MDQGTLGKIGSQVDEANTSGKVTPNSSQAQKQPATPISTSDTVILTSSAKLLERLDKTLESLPAINVERVAEIKTAIESGDYVIDSAAIAEAMIRLDRSLGE